MKTILKAGITVFLLIISMCMRGADFPQHMNGMANGPLFNYESLYALLHAETSDSSFNHIDSRYNIALDKVKQQADALKEYLKANNYNTEYCFLVDMSLPSGKKRFFVYNLRTHMIEKSSLVSHGLGSNDRASDEAVRFSNDPSSLQTSLGRYRIGSSYKGNFGLAFKLYGLDKTNDRAFERAIVLHAHSSIPATETYPIPISVSFGCPSVAPSFLEELNAIIKSSKKPILMWVYN